MTPSAVPPAPASRTAEAAPAPAFHALDYHELRRSSEVDVAWLWQGYLAPGNVTLLTSQWKCGKTTLVSVLLARLKTGGTFAGLPLRAGRAVVVSEEAPSHWLGRGRSLDLAGHVRWLCRPFLGRPTPQDWQALVEYLAGLADASGLELAVIDPLASFLPGHSENSA